MRNPASYFEVFLQPGEYYFGDRETRIRTLLGSCVSVTIWHPQLLVGGMCHYMLPAASKARRDLDGRYADQAVAYLMQEVERAGTHPGQYQAKIFGGGKMFAVSNPNKDVGQKNIEAGRHLLDKHGFVIAAEHLGGVGHRNVIFDIWNGDVWVKHAQEIMP